MRVSKHHCNLFETTETGDDDDDYSQQTFHVSDTGSMYGTYLLSHNDLKAGRFDEHSRIPTSAFQRLSEPKKMSQPASLRHGDLLRVGATTFEVHVHAWPCDRCSINTQGSNEIPLFAKAAKSDASVPGSTTSDRRSQTGDSTHASQNYNRGEADSQAQRRKQLAELRSSYLSQSSKVTQSSFAAASKKASYVDRAAQRRARQPAEFVDASFERSRQDVAAQDAVSKPPVMSTYPSLDDHTHPATESTLNTESNIGHRLFSHMRAGATNPSDEINRPPVVAARNATPRAGLGSQTLQDAHEAEWQRQKQEQAALGQKRRPGESIEQWHRRRKAESKRARYDTVVTGE